MQASEQVIKASIYNENCKKNVHAKQYNNSVIFKVIFFKVIN